MSFTDIKKKAPLDSQNANLLVFTVCANDYTTLKGKICNITVIKLNQMNAKLDSNTRGRETVFSNIEDTGIPKLQKYCHQLTVSRRQETVIHMIASLCTSLAQLKLRIEEKPTSPKELEEFRVRLDEHGLLIHVKTRVSLHDCKSLLG